MIMSHYDVLGAPADAEYAEIRSKYRAAILALHPDKFSGALDRPAKTLHSDLNEGLRVFSRPIRDDLIIPPNKLISSKIKELEVEDHLVHSPTTCSGEEFRVGEEAILSRFLRVQRAWEVLRDPESRATYDSFLSTERFIHDLNSRGEETTTVIGEEVTLQEMDSVNGDHEEVEYSYPCRCGDSFVVSQRELCIAGVEFEEDFSHETSMSELQRTGRCRSCKATEKGELEQVDGGINAGPEPDWQSTHSLVLPCQSCSLHLRLHLFC